MPDGDGDVKQGGSLDPTTVQLVLKETKELVRSLEGTGVRRVKVKAGALEIDVERRLASGQGVVTTSAATDGAQAASGVGAGLMPVLAPLVGVFYRAGTPGAKPFVEPGDMVERGQQIAIVEAMKTMNEVTSDYRGRVKEILVENGQPVQFEQRLMLIDVSGSS
jgi:acetyl-CoA carboxylase biotin carboxyl carrier protein